MYTLFKSLLNRLLYRLSITLSNKRKGVPLNILISWCGYSTIEKYRRQNHLSVKRVVVKESTKQKWRAVGYEKWMKVDDETKETGKDRYLYTKIIGKKRENKMISRTNNEL